MIAQAFDARLNPVHSCLTQGLDLRARKIRLDLVKDLQRTARMSERRQHIAEVFHVENVIDSLDIGQLPTIDQLLEFVERAARTLAAKGHGSTVKSAESAVRLGSPPTATRSFEEQGRSNRRRYRALGQVVKVVAEIRHRQSVHLTDQVGAAG